jgi:hypothetical protein
VSGTWISRNSRRALHQALSLDPTFKSEEVRLSLERATQKAARQDQVDYLAEVDGLIGVAASTTPWRAPSPSRRNSRQPADRRSQEGADRAVKACEKFVSDRIATLWFLRTASWRARCRRSSASKRRSNTSAARCRRLLEYVTKEASAITQEANPDNVKKLWLARKKTALESGVVRDGHVAARPRRRAQGNEPAKPNTKPVTEKDKERAELEQKLDRYLKNQEMARKAKTTAENRRSRSGVKELSPDNARAGCWPTTSENSGASRSIPRPMFTACRECGGEGTRNVGLAGANVSKSAAGKGINETKMECPFCHGLGVVRRISYR